MNNIIPIRFQITEEGLFPNKKTEIPKYIKNNAVKSMIDKKDFAAMILNFLDLKGDSKKEDACVIISGLKIALIRNKKEYIKGRIMIIP